MSKGICAQCNGEYWVMTSSQFCGLDCFREFSSKEYTPGVRPCAVCEVPIESDGVHKLKCDECIALSHSK